MSTSVPTKCIGCGSDRLSYRRAYRTNTKFGRRVFRGASLFECDVCHLVQLAPQPDPQVLADYYAWDYRRVAIYGTDVADPATFPKDNLFYYNRGQSAASLLAPHVASPRPVILDIGAGYGHVLHALAERFPESERMAIEFSAVCVRHLEKLGVRVFDQPAESVLPDLDKQFDLVIISHVLEHVQDPRALLELVRTKLKPGGLLYVEVPNIPLEAVLRYPDHVWAPRYDEPHISFFSEDALRGLLESIGLDVEFADTAGPEYRYISPLRFRMPHARWAIQRLIPKPLFHFLRRRVLTKPLRVNEREEAFYKYGGFRIWIRSISRWPGKAAANASLRSEAYAST